MHVRAPSTFPLSLHHSEGPQSTEGSPRAFTSTHGINPYSFQKSANGNISIQLINQLWFSSPCFVKAVAINTFFHKAKLQEMDAASVINCTQLQEISKFVRFTCCYTIWLPSRRKIWLMFWSRFFSANITAPDEVVFQCPPSPHPLLLSSIVRLSWGNQSSDLKLNNTVIRWKLNMQ